MTVLLLLAGLASAQELLAHDFLLADQLPPAPPDAAAAWGVVDLDELVIVRPPTGAFQEGFDYTAFRDAIIAAISDRETVYDVAMLVHSEALPTQYPGAAAFHLAFNNADTSGIGRTAVATPEIPVRSGVWFNHVNYWDTWPEGIESWVFCHELGHQWLSFARFDDGIVKSQELLGRQRAHWSYFVDTPNSPMEGNAWVDNKDGTFTTDLSTPSAFSALDLYLMGLLPPEDVPPFFYIDAPDTAERGRETSPEHVYNDEPVTVSGSRVDVTIDDIIAANGQRSPAYGEAPTEQKILYVLVVSPNELLTEETVGRALERVDGWVDAWDTCTSGLGSMFIGVVDEGRAPPDASAPALIPGGAW
jgi:hypothetical protein